MLAIYLLDLAIGGQTLRYATSPIEVTDRSGDTYLYREGLDADVVSMLATDTAVQITTPPSGPSWATRALHTEFEKGRVVLRYYRTGDLLEDTLTVMQGTTTKVSWGGPQEPLTLTIDGSMVDLSRDVPDPLHVVERGKTWPKLSADLDEKSEGIHYPVVIGYPGYYDGGVYPAYRGGLVSDRGTLFGGSNYLVADRHENTATSVTVWSMTEPSISRLLSVSTNSLDALGQPVTTANLPQADGPAEQGVEIWVGHSHATGGGMASHEHDGPVRGAGEVIERLLTDYSSIDLDIGRMRTYQPILDLYKIDTALDKPIPAYEWVDRALLEILPARPMMSAKGLYFRPFRYQRDPGSIVHHLNADLRQVVRTSSVTPRFEVANDFSITFGKHKNGFAASRRLTGDPEALRQGWWGQLQDERVAGDISCRLSEARHGRITADPIETAVIWDPATAVQVLRDRAAMHAMPPWSIQYVAPIAMAGAIEPGDHVALTDSELALSSVECLVEDVALALDEVIIELSVLRSS